MPSAPVAFPGSNRRPYPYQKSGLYPPEASAKPVVQVPRARAARIALGQANQGRASQRPVAES
jgi:hypothetical protein